MVLTSDTIIVAVVLHLQLYHMPSTLFFQSSSYILPLFLYFSLFQRLHLPPDLSETVSRVSKTELAAGCGTTATGNKHLDFQRIPIPPAPSTPCDVQGQESAGAALRQHQVTVTPALTHLLSLLVNEIMMAQHLITWRSIQDSDIQGHKNLTRTCCCLWTKRECDANNDNVVWLPVSFQCSLWLPDVYQLSQLINIWCQ